MWTDFTRAEHARKGLRYSSDLTDAEWAVLEAVIPLRSGLGRPPKWSLRTIMDGMLYVLRSGLPWRMPPEDFPPVSTVQRYFYAWRDSGLWKTINHLFVMTLREAAAREASPRADVFDYIECFYNPRRRHSTIGYVSPMEFEAMAKVG